MAQEFYCMKCRRKWNTNDFRVQRTKRGGNMAVSNHDCGTKCCRMVAK